MNVRTMQIVARSLGFLWRYPLRSALLMLSAATGVAGVVCSVNYGAGGTKQILDQIRRMGTNILFISPAQSRTIAGRARTGLPVTTLVERDNLGIRHEVLSLTRSSAFVAGNFWLKAGVLSKNTVVVGCEPDYFLIRNWPTSEGQSLDANQERTALRVVVLGRTVARDLFGSASPVGERLLISRTPFTVIGVLSERGQGLDVVNEDNQVYIPLSTAMRRLMNVDHYSGILVEIDSFGEMDRASSQIGSLLRQRHHIQPGQPDDFQIQNQKALLDTRLAAAGRLNFFLRWIGASTLVVSGTGMLGITWIAVRERTREFGTRRALGATASDIFLHVVSECTALALTGCVVGLSLSWPLSRFISEASGVNFVFKDGAALLACATSAILNIGFSLWPSRRAASLNPTEALRYE